MTTKMANTAYLVNAGGTLLAFVSTPFNWIRTHWCVLVVPCEHCKAAIGEPCVSVGYSRPRLDRMPKSATHYVRRDAAKRQKPNDALLGVALSMDALSQGHVRTAVSRARGRKP